jgi:hypothetical protein
MDHLLFYTHNECRADLYEAGLLTNGAGADGHHRPIVASREEALSLDIAAGIASHDGGERVAQAIYRVISACTGSKSMRRTCARWIAGSALAFPPPAYDSRPVMTSRRPEIDQLLAANRLQAGQRFSHINAGML